VVGRSLIVTALALAWGLVSSAPAVAADESFKVLQVSSTGCTSGSFGMLVLRSNLDGGTYVAHTVVTAGDLVYMNEEATISINGESGWNLFNNFTYGPVPNPGTWPIPPDKRMRIDFTLERPKGTVLFSWRLIVDGCNTGRVLYNDQPAADTDGDLVPVPRDRCPKLEATTANGCPTRSLELAYDSSGRRLIGWLAAAGFPKLYANRAVTIWKVRPGPDKRVGGTKTGSRGNFALRLPGGSGTYYATTGTVGPVPKETSRKVRVR
jgi:hypothetical protein